LTEAGAVKLAFLPDPLMLIASALGLGADAPVVDFLSLLLLPHAASASEAAITSRILNGGGICIRATYRDRTGHA
jgi:hypothetical protein